MRGRHAEESLAIGRKLAAADPGRAGLAARRERGLDRVGDVRLAAGDRPGALTAYEESLAIRRKLACRRSGQCLVAARRERSLEKGGRRAAGGGRPAGALTAYEESLAIRRKLAAADPGNADWQADLALRLYKVSTVADVPRRGPPCVRR